MVDEDRFEEALRLVDELLQDEKLPPSLLPILGEMQLKLLLHLERFEELLEKEEVHPSLKSYAHYRLHQYEKAKSICEEGALSQLVLAQSLYRLHDASALDLYKRLLSDMNDEEEILQVQTNALAVAAAHAVPRVESSACDFINTSSNNCDYLYNLATYQLLTGTGNRSMLQEAREVCDYEADAAAIDVQLYEWSLLWNGLTNEEVHVEDIPAAVSLFASSIKQLPSSRFQQHVPAIGQHCNNASTTTNVLFYSSMLQLSRTVARRVSCYARVYHRKRRMLHHPSVIKRRK